MAKPAAYHFWTATGIFTRPDPEPRAPRPPEPRLRGRTAHLVRRRGRGGWRAGRVLPPRPAPSCRALVEGRRRWKRQAGILAERRPERTNRPPAGGACGEEPQLIGPRKRPASRTTSKRQESTQPSPADSNLPPGFRHLSRPQPHYRQHFAAYKPDTELHANQFKVISTILEQLSRLQGSLYWRIIDLPHSARVSLHR